MQPNTGKKIEIDVQGKTWHRYPIKTALFAKGDDYAEKIASEVMRVISNSSFLIPNFTFGFILSRRPCFVQYL